MKNSRWYIFAGGISCLAVGAFFVLWNGSTQARITYAPTIFHTAIVAPNHLRIAAEKPATLFVAGDIMLGRSVAEQITKFGSAYPFEKTEGVVTEASCAVANLEGPMTTMNASPTNRMVFHFDPTLGPILAAAGFDGVSMANNHGLDQGAKGVADTEKNLAAAGVGYFGSYGTDDGPVYDCLVGTTRVAFIGLHDVYRKVDVAAAAKTIARARANADVVIPFMHWGNEYHHDHSAHQTELAHALIDAGADMVIGAHPHVVEGMEVYKGKPVFYSLGNFIFDQYFSTDTQQGLALRFNFGKDGTSVDLLPYVIPVSQPTFADGPAKAKMLNDIATWSAPELKDQILSGRVVLSGG